MITKKALLLLFSTIAISTNFNLNCAAAEREERNEVVCYGWIGDAYIAMGTITGSIGLTNSILLKMCQENCSNRETGAIWLSAFTLFSVLGVGCYKYLANRARKIKIEELQRLLPDHAARLDAIA